MKTFLCFLAALAFCALTITGVRYAAADDPPRHDRVATATAEHPYRPLFSETAIAQADLAPDAGVKFIDPPAAAAAPVDAGSAAGSGSATTPTPTPAEKLHNVVDDPLAAISDARALYKQGWAIFLLGLVVMTTATFARAAAKWPTVSLFAFFEKHKTVILVVSGIGATAAAAFNAIALGGTWFAAAYAALGAAFTMVAPTGAGK